MKSLVLGGSSVDTLIHVPEIQTIEDDMSLWATNKVRTIGGTGAGKALCLDALGQDVTLITDLGNDDLREEVLSYFSSTKVKLLPVDTDKTTAHTNIMHSGGKRISVFTSYPSVMPEIHSNMDQIIADVDVVFLNINEFCRRYIPIIKRLNKPVIVDIHDYDMGNPYHQDFIDCADILVASSVNILDSTTFMKNQIINGRAIVIVTKGSEGLIAMDNQYNTYKMKGYNDYTYVDSNGAGDSFTAGFVSSYIRYKNIKEALLFGTICGGIACTSFDLFNREYNLEMINNIAKGNPL